MNETVESEGDILFGIRRSLFGNATVALAATSQPGEWILIKAAGRYVFSTPIYLSIYLSPTGNDH